MAEMRIPADRIPADILQRLHAIGQSMSWETSLSPAKTSTSQATSTTTLASSSAPSSSPCADAPSASFSSATRPQHLQSSLPSITSSDEVDGGSCESVFQLSRSSPRKRKFNDILDDSGIVRVFPLEEEEDKSMKDRSFKPHSDSDKNMEAHTFNSHSDSEIVRIFPRLDSNRNDVDESSIVRVLTPTSSFGQAITSQPESSRLLTDLRPTWATSCGDWNLQLSGDCHPKPFVINSQDSVQPTCHSTPKRSPMNSANSVAKDATNFAKTLSPRLSPGLSGMGQSSTRNQFGDQQRSARKCQLTSGVSVNPRPSPGLPTPPQTPDDADADDDEVFTYSAPSRDDVIYRPFQCEPIRNTMDSTPRRHIQNSRHNSDRSGEVHQRIINRSLPANSAHFPGLNFGDIFKTRKRLSFDEDAAQQSAKPPPYHHSEPASIQSTVFPPHCGVPSSSGLALVGASQKYHLDPQKGDSSECNYQAQNRPSSFHAHCPSPIDHSMKASQSSPLAQKVTSVTQIQGPAISSHPPVVNNSAVRDVFTVLEGAMRQQLSKAGVRSRLHSEGDDVTDQQESRDRNSPILETHARRRQSFSGSKRRRQDEESEKLQCQTSPGHFQMSWPQEKSSDTGGDCACSKIARNFLQMVEGAYRGVSQMGSAQTGLVQFRQELSQTNDILRESLSIVQQFRAMCQHGNRALLPDSPVTLSQQ